MIKKMKSISLIPYDNKISTAETTSQLSTEISYTVDKCPMPPPKSDIV